MQSSRRGTVPSQGVAGRPFPNTHGSGELVLSVESNANVIPLLTDRGRLASAERRVPRTVDKDRNPSSLFNPNTRASAEQIAAAAPGRFGSDLVLIDTDVDGLARQFLDSPYGSDEYANWPLDRRLEGFLQHRDLGHLADNGDIFTIICDRVMTSISCQHLHGGDSGKARAQPTPRR